VALQCDIVKTHILRRKVDSFAVRAFWEKESLRKGAKSAQTLYMTVMTAPQKRRPAQYQAGRKATDV